MNERKRYLPGNSNPIEIILKLAGKPFFWIVVGLVVLVYTIYRSTVKALGLGFSAIRRVRVPKTRIKIRRAVSSIAISLVLTALILGGLYIATWSAVLKNLPRAEDLNSRHLDVTTRIYDRSGVLLYKIFKDKNRTPIKLSEVPLTVRMATIAAEDAEFYKHPGFSIKGIGRALIKYFKEDKLTGGSTITQQLVKNALLTPERTIERKVKEIALAVAVEQKFSKDEILEMYLNEVAYGGTAYGIGEAAKVYFNKEVKNLSIAEAALLAGLPKSPTLYSPFGPNPDAAIERQREVIKLMAENGFISTEEAEKARGEKIVFAEDRSEIKAPHFVMYVRHLLVEKFGEEVVEKGGLEVITTLDYKLQLMAERIVREEVDKLSGFRVSNGAALVVNPRNGEILAMVGSKDYFDVNNDGNVNVLERLRQPGSSIKVVNYAYALENGYTAATILKDAPITFSVVGSKPYSPKNYDGAFRGNLSLRSAFAESRNVPAVRVLATYGVDKMVEMGRKMGISSWKDPTDYGLSLTLGGGDVKLIDLAGAYATIANYGKRNVISSVSEIKNYEGKTLYQRKCSENASCEGEKVVDPRVAYIIIDILKDNVARAPAFGNSSALVIPGHGEIAVKTGTSNSMRDNVTVGFNQDYLVASWVGNNDNTPMSRIASGVTGAAPIWNKIMFELVKDASNHPWEIPDGLVQVDICSLTGTLPCPGCPTRKEWFLKENIPMKACNPEMFKKKEEEKRENKEGEIL